MTGTPVFYDPSGRRRRRFRVAVAAFAALLVVAGVALVVTIGAVPAAPLLPIQPEHPALHRLPPPHGGLLHRTRRTVDWYARRLFGGAPRSQATAGNRPLAIAFHAPWDESSAASLARHVDQLDWVIPGWLSVTGADHRLTSFRDTAGRAIINRAAHRPLVVPMIQNALDGQWDGAGTAALLHDARWRARLVERLASYVTENRAGGVFVDFEELPPGTQGDYRRFLAELHARFAAHGWIVAIAAPVGDAAWNLPALARIVDRVFLMTYDEHETGGPAGPIASQRWFAEAVARAARGIPRDRLVVAFGNYAYDWHDGGGDALDVEEAWQEAADSAAVPSWDTGSGNSGFAYSEGPSRHVVWLLDAASAYNQLRFLQRAGIGGVALWRLGSEDPGLWSIFGRDHRRLPPAAAIDALPAGTNVDIEGTGEVLKIAGVPVAGARQAATGADGSLASVGWRRLPSPYVVQRTGYRPGEVALTFDDGPDAEWTPRILDILKRAHVPATFFIVGENALTQRALLQRMIAEGHEIGSHTYTHPNLAAVSPREVRFELNATQRLFQAFTGRSLRLFRAPYFGDAEPTTADEIEPALMAQQRGYVSVGLHVDPGDWKRPGVEAIVDRTVEGVTASTAERSGNIVLLHDAGGNRAQTIAALPLLIARLRARGVRFVPVSALAGLTRDQAMPPISAGDRAAAMADLAVFTGIGDAIVALRWLFAFAITIGIARAVALSALALVQARREAAERFPPVDPARFVTVMIPAFNEERVIERAVRGVLASSDVAVEVIVVDDGSRDDTAGVVARAFGDDPRVRLLRLENGGKARALNRALALARGEVVIALDADTQFEPATIARLARWFDDPGLGRWPATPRSVIASIWSPAGRRWNISPRRTWSGARSPGSTR